MIHTKIVNIEPKLERKINRYLNVEPKNEEECLSEDETIITTVDFGNGMSMDIKCCGVQYEENSSNLAYTEAVLFHNGSQVAYTEPEDEYSGRWELEYKGDIYSVLIGVAPEVRKSFSVSMPDGDLKAEMSPDPRYPGIEIEFIPDDENQNRIETNPRVLIEREPETGRLRALIWNDKNSEDYTQEIYLN